MNWTYEYEIFSHVKLCVLSADVTLQRCESIALRNITTCSLTLLSPNRRHGDQFETQSK